MVLIFGFRHHAVAPDRKAYLTPFLIDNSSMHLNLRWFLFLMVPACSSPEVPSPQEEYVSCAFDSIRVHSMHRETFDLDSLEAEVMERISDSSSQWQVILELESAIKAIDRHSYILTADRFRNLKGGTAPEVLENPYPFHGEMISGKYGMISLSGFMGVDSVSSCNYVDSLQRVILHLYRQQPRGWIINLKDNTGGWGYAMLAGVGPILGKGVKAYLVSGEGVEEEYYYMKDESDYLSISDSAYTLPEQLPVAVLIGEGTASAGELLTLAFRGNPKTILIGEPTYGVSTSLRGFFMSDSTQICVTHAVMTDRIRRGDGGVIRPDVAEPDPVQVYERAYQWIEDNQASVQ